MSVLTPIKKETEQKVNFSEYIKTENTPEPTAKPAEPAKPDTAESK